MGQQGALTAQQMELLGQPDFAELLSLYTTVQSALGPDPTNDASAIQLRALMGNEVNNPLRLFLERYLVAIPAYLDAYDDNRERNVWLTAPSLEILSFRKRTLAAIGISSWKRLGIFALYHIAIPIGIGLSQHKRGLYAVLAATRYAQLGLAILDELALATCKPQVEQQCLPGVIAWILDKVPLEPRWAMEDAPMPQNLEEYEQTSFDLLEQLEQTLQTTPNATALKRIRPLLQSHIVALQTRSTIEARRVRECGWWEAVRVCGNAIYPRGVTQTVPRISKTRKRCIYCAYAVMCVLPPAIAALVTQSWVVVGTFTLLVFQLMLGFCRSLPRYYKEVFDHAVVPPPAVLTYIPGCGWLGKVGWVVFVFSIVGFVLALGIFMNPPNNNMHSPA